MLSTADSIESGFDAITFNQPLVLSHDITFMIWCYLRLLNQILVLSTMIAINQTLVLSTDDSNQTLVLSTDDIIESDFGAIY